MGQPLERRRGSRRRRPASPTTVSVTCHIGPRLGWWRPTARHGLVRHPHASLTLVRPSGAAAPGRRGGRPRARTPARAPGPARGVDRPSSPGSSVASKLTSPRATAWPFSSRRSTGSPATKSPSTAGDARRRAATAAGRRRRARRRRRGAAARAASVACASQSSRVGSRAAGRRGSRVPTGSPASAGADLRRPTVTRTTGMPGAGGDPRGLDLGHHAAASRRPARPGLPEPHAGEVGVAAHLGDQRAPAARRVAVVEPVDVGEQHEQVGVHQVGDQRGEPVVVAEADLVGGDRVVLVDDRQRRRARAAGRSVRWALR